MTTQKTARPRGRNPHFVNLSSWLKPRGSIRGGEQKPRAAVSRPDGQPETYGEALAVIPAPGSTYLNRGCHPWLLTAANLGRVEGQTRKQIAADLRANIPPGSRHVPDSEIEATVGTAFRKEGASRDAKPSPARPEQYAKIVEAGAGATLDTIRELSPVTIEDEASPIELLERLYRPEEFVWTGDKYDSAPENVRTAGEWIERYRGGEEPAPHIIPNTVTGREGLTLSGEPSFRADSAVAAYRFALMEFDDKPIEEQAALWAAMIRRGLSVAAIIHSAGKSLHAWLRVDCEGPEAWGARVRGNIFNKTFIPLGVDPANRNAARLSRNPGHVRRDKKTKRERAQRLLFLDVNQTEKTKGAGNGR